VCGKNGEFPDRPRPRRPRRPRKQGKIEDEDEDENEEDLVWALMPPGEKEKTGLVSQRMAEEAGEVRMSTT